MNIKKKIIFIYTIATSAILMLNGCNDNNSSNSAVEKTTKNQSVKHNVVKVIESSGDMYKSAKTFEELVDDSEFIAEVKITETTSSISTMGNMIYTNLTPEIITLYKGTYSGEKLSMYGGYMNVKEYYSSDISKAALKDNSSQTDCSEKELESQEIYQNWFNSYIPDVGDTAIFFGNLAKDGTYRITYEYQGMFKCEGNDVSNQALVINDKSGFTENLVKDLQEEVSSAKIVEKDIKFSNQKKVLSLAKEDFIEKIKCVK